MKRLLLSFAFLTFSFTASAQSNPADVFNGDFANVLLQQDIAQPSSPVEEYVEPSRSSYLSLAIHWGVVPAILVIILLYAFNLPQKISDPQIKTSGNAGIFAGLVVFIIFVVSQQKRGLVFSLAIPSYDFNFLAVLLTSLGVVFGFVIAWIVDAIKRYRALGFLVLFIVATTTIAIYGYFFIKDVRSVVVFISLGVMLGALLHIIWFPEAMTKYSISTPDNDKSIRTTKATYPREKS